MRFDFLVSVEVERTEGKFASRDDIAAELAQTLEFADPSSIDGIGADGTSSYETTDWSVEEQAQPRRLRPQQRPKLREAADRSRARKGTP